MELGLRELKPFPSGFRIPVYCEVDLGSVCHIHSAIRNNNVVQGYWLKRNQIGVEGCREILEALESNPNLTTLDLVQNDLGVEVRLFYLLGPLL